VIDIRSSYFFSAADAAFVLDDSDDMRVAQRIKAASHKDLCRHNNVCINGPVHGGVSRNGRVHGPVVSGGKCQACVDAAHPQKAA
jgi:hypothetical protein